MLRAPAECGVSSKVAERSIFATGHQPSEYLLLIATWSGDGVAKRHQVPHRNYTDANRPLNLKVFHELSLRCTASECSSWSDQRRNNVI